MKKWAIALVCAAGLTAIAFASKNNRNTTKQDIEKKQELKQEKKECRRSCLFG